MGFLSKDRSVPCSLELLEPTFFCNPYGVTIRQDYANPSVSTLSAAEILRRAPPMRTHTSEWDDGGVWAGLQSRLEAVPSLGYTISIKLRPVDDVTRPPYRVECTSSFNGVP